MVRLERNFKKWVKTVQGKRRLMAPAKRWCHGAFMGKVLLSDYSRELCFGYFRRGNSSGMIPQIPIFRRKIVHIEI